ncbi:unnamed protein product, partial [Laminaria digitata]
GSPRPEFGWGKAGLNDTLLAGAAVDAASLLQGAGAGADDGDGRKDEQRQLRLARNRESAKESRRKKKEKLVLLDMQVAELIVTIEGEKVTRLSDAARTLRDVKRQ